MVISIKNFTLVHVLVYPQFTILLFIVSSESETFSFFSDFLVYIVDKKVAVSSLPFISSHEFNGGLNGKHKGSQITLRRRYILDGSILVSPKTILYSITISEYDLTLLIFFAVLYE
jgi:hypothetical protein